MQFSTFQEISTSCLTLNHLSHLYTTSHRKRYVKIAFGAEFENVHSATLNWWSEVPNYQNLGLN